MHVLVFVTIIKMLSCELSLASVPFENNLQASIKDKKSAFKNSNL